MLLVVTRSFPRLYAAASLKPPLNRLLDTSYGRFPRLYAAASLKQYVMSVLVRTHIIVFRGSMPRPH